MSRDWSYRVWDKREKTYSDKAFSIDQYGLLYVQDEDGYWEEASARYIFEFSTGLKDMNGKEIYDGDILEYDWYTYGDRPAYRVKSQVVFDDMGARVEDDRIRNCSNVEVVGNVHEDPELVGG